MMFFLKTTVILSVVFVSVQADVSHILYDHHETTIAPHAEAPGPYVFSYQAGRAPGHIDRQHTEISDGSGVVRGSFAYVDPRNEVRTVQYVADEHGFHPQLSHQLEDSEAVKRAKAKHFELYNRIAQEHANPSFLVQTDSYAGPRDTPAVVGATNKHLSLYAKIAAEHAAIGAQHEEERRVLVGAGDYGEHSDSFQGQYQDHHQHY